VNELNMDSYFGKYRGQVMMNVDPDGVGRVQVSCPAVFGTGVLAWAMPSVPLSGMASGIFCVPIVGSKVWVEFEGGNTQYPIYSGGFWGLRAEVPPTAAAGNPVSPSIILQTSLQNMISISDMPGPAGGIMIKSMTGAMIMVNDVGITITNGKGATITMMGPTIDMNAGAFTVI
jgi:uncharacterized protein involved in type VI secretion and phage assembly